MKLSRNPSQNRNFQQAIQYHQAGRWEAAKATYNTVIRLEPGNFRALNNLGLILLGEGNSDAAKALFEQSATQDPNYPEALNNLGNLHRSRGDFDASQVYFERARRANPAHVPTHINLGLLFESCGKLDHAIDCYRDGLRINPNLREGHLNLGSALQRSGLADQAIVCYQKAAELDPNYAEPLNNLGTLFQSRGDFDTALAYFEKAIQANPQYGITHINLGRLFESYGKLDRAIACYRNGLQIIPNSPEGHLNLGNALQRSVRIDEAIACYQQAIALQPDFPIAYANLGAALQAQGKVTPAMAALQQALRLQPDQIDALLNLGNVMTALGRIDEAINCYERILALQPAHAGALSNQLLALNYADSISPRELAQRSFKAGAQIQQSLPATRSGTDPRPGKRLRVGYVSPDFRGHAVAYFLEPLMRAHDRAEVEVFCYAEVSVPDRVTARFQSLADHWRWTVGVGDEELAAQIRADDIDILIDVAGHSANNRLPVFARRPAPVQVTWLGYPNTTGLASIDYRLIDAITDPPGAADKLAAETLLRIDGGFLCYQPPDDAPEPAPFADAGFITFGSFNNLAKLSDTTLQVWGRLLAMVPNARLLLKSARFQEQEPKTQIMARLNQHGIATDRVILLGASKHAADQLAAYRHVDIALDPFPYNGTTTTCETLWMGVPVVTLLGDSHRSRVGASLLTGIGCTGLIAHDHDDYIRIAAELAADPIRLQALRH
ncbi:MAG: hypothetical protein QOF70_788, partial [Acetobacteraceae bacterium]|nr:hypothetical protein [Acetobacteraceae bacterium]